VLGTPDAVRRSALAGAAKAIELIDMEQHAGSHPRMGAADVIPFVPLRGITVDQTVELARDFARELADTLGLPVYLYDRPSLIPERGCVTVSMNLVDHEVTGLRTAFEAVRVEAQKRGMTTLSSEIVGLVPQAAIAEGDVIDLRLEGFDGDQQILERLVSSG